MLKKMMKKISSGITAALMCLSMVSALPAAVINVSAEGTNMDLGAPAHEKTLTSNGDGTYNLSLSVKGESKASSEKTKADVVVVFDASSSMDKDGRLGSAKSSVNLLADDLLSNNTSGNNDTVRLSLVKFGSIAKTVKTNMTSASDFKNNVNSIRTYDDAYGGTNWEAALRLANDIETRSDAEKYVILVSDGLPTFRDTAHPYKGQVCEVWGCYEATIDDNKYYDGRKSYQWYGNGKNDNQEGREGKNYSDAVANAKNIIDSGKQLYTVNVYQDDSETLMSQLVKDAYNDNNLIGHDFHAKDETNLKNAFANIIKQIRHSATYQNVTIVDPLTPETGIVGSSPTFTYEVTDKDGKIVNDGLKLTDGSDITLPAAQYDSTTRTVTWNLGSTYNLPDGYTFKVSFEVFPTQETADKIAGFKNGNTYNSDKNPNIIKENGNYKVYSNTADAKVTYHVVKDNVAGDELSTTYNRPTMDVNPVLVHLTKNWEDSLDTGVRPDSIAFDVMQDGKIVDEITLSKDNWTRDYYLAAGIVKADGTTVRTSGHLYSFNEKLVDADSKKYEITSASTKPMYVNGTLKEAKTGSYEEFDSNHNVSVGTNTLKGRLEIKKTVETAEGSAPAPADTEFTINVILNKNGEQIASKYNVYNADGERTVTGSTTSEGVKTITLKANESVVFDNLDTGTTYTVEEVNIPEGFTNRSIDYSNKVITANHKDVVTVVNDYFRITANKEWSDNDNQDGKRIPVTFKLQSSTDGTAWHDVDGSERTIGTTDNSSTAWTGYPAKDASGNKLKYQVVESNVPNGYTSSVTGNKGNYIITNKYTPEKITISGTKTWNDNNNQDGKRPTSITVNLLKNGIPFDSKTVTAENGWKYEFKDLPKYSDGKKINYTVRENAVAEYTTKIDGYDITNSYQIKTKDVTVTKTWDDANNQDGKRPTSVTVHLLADNVVKETVTIEAKDNWQHKFENLPVYKDGKEIVYTVTEEPLNVNGYTSKVEGYNVINSYTPETVTVSGSKIWDDNNNQDGKRPTSITVNLSDGEGVVASKEVTEKDGWAYSFKDLPKYKNGTEITYTVSEAKVPDGYTETEGTKDNDYVIKNTHTPAKVSVSGQKTWDDGDNQDGIRPPSITVNLLADGKKVDSKTVTADDN